MPKRTRIVIGGVDTHGRTHHAAVIDQQGRLLGDRQFPADRAGYRQLLSWLGRHGQLGAVGVEGTGSYGAGLTQALLDQGVRVVEVDRPDRRTRRQRGKSDPIVPSRYNFLYSPQGRPCGRPPAAAVLAPATKRVVTGGPTSPSSTRKRQGRYIPAVGRNCAEGDQQEATGGTVIYTVVTNTLMAASYNLLFSKSRVQGSFSAPTYVLCAPRPTARTCIK